MFNFLKFWTLNVFNVCIGCFRVSFLKFNFINFGIRILWFNLGLVFIL